MIRFFGYLDPGTGSMIVQALIGVIAAVSIFARRVIGGTARKVVSVFRRRKPLTQENEEDE